MTQRPDDPADSLAAKVVAALDRLARGQRSFRQAVASRHGLTPLQAEILSTLAQGPPPEPLVGRLATELGVAQPTVTDSLQSLEAKRLLRRAVDPADRRRTVVALTRRGAALAHELAASDRTLTGAVCAMRTPTQETTLEVLLGLIAQLVAAGVIDVARTCTTCRFHRFHAGRHRCALLDIDLPPADLRVNCPDHQPRTAA
ncbi:MAG TPA: MarR family winged helix-turn-helix transcriptional regulator [Acidimicrobiales bacterium]|nr:MarR family winged helix-turn-helix transcriptional regulator [Acidimicrobiales bacterium]